MKATAILAVATLGLTACAGEQLDDDTAALGAAPCLDVNGDGLVSPIDALLIINQLNKGGGTVPPAPATYDTNGDNYVSAIDALLVINYLNGGPSPCPVGDLPDSERCERALDRAFIAVVERSADVAQVAGQDITDELKAVTAQWQAPGSSLRAQTVSQCLGMVEDDPVAVGDELDCIVAANGNDDVLDCTGAAIQQLFQLGVGQ